MKRASVSISFLIALLVGLKTAEPAANAQGVRDDPNDNATVTQDQMPPTF